MPIALLAGVKRGPREAHARGGVGACNAFVRRQVPAVLHFLG
ncbi:MAG: hypothetical protein ACREX8_12315 [Gammaproteobacteria bacterium]